MNRARRRVIVAVLAMTAPALAHHAPNSFVRLHFRADSVWAKVMLPQSELAYAMNGAPSAAALPAYLLRHVGAASTQGAAWTVRVAAVSEMDYLEHAYFAAELELSPPAGSSTRDFVLTSDAVTHEVRNHVVFVVAERDYADAALEHAPQFLGALQYPARQLAIRRSDQGRPAAVRPAPARRPAGAPAK